MRALKYFIKDSTEDWYRACLTQFAIDDIDVWKISFLTVFGERGWSKVEYALTYKYLYGSYSDYAIKKLRLLLEIERKMTTESKINQIVVGLPPNVRKLIDRKEIIDVESLMNTLSKFEASIKSNYQQSRNEANQPNKKMANPSKASKEKPELRDKRPCSICANMNFPNRFHPVEKCWNKDEGRIPGMQVHMNDKFVKAETADEAKKKKLIHPEKLLPLIRLRVVVNGEKEVEALYDTGSNVSLINHDLVNKLRLNLSDDRKIFQTLSGRNFTRGRVKLKLKIGETEESIEAYAVKNDNFTYDLLLGLDSIRKFRLTQDEKLCIRQKREEDKREKRSEISQKSEKEIQSHYSPSNTKKLAILLEKHKDTFTDNKFDVGVVKDHEARMKLVMDRYVAKKPYRYSISDQKAIDNLIEELLKKD